MGKFSVGHYEKLAPSDIEEGTRICNFRAGEIG
jgi:hypothetical protein